MGAGRQTQNMFPVLDLEYSFSRLHGLHFCPTQLAHEVTYMCNSFSSTLHKAVQPLFIAVHNSLEVDHCYCFCSMYYV